MNDKFKKIGNYTYNPIRIGKGNFSTIYKGKDINTQEIVAIKKIEVENINKLKKNVRREIDLHKKLIHPNIIALYDVIFDYENHTIYLVMEYCDGGDFTKFQNKRPIKEQFIQRYMRQFRDGLKYLANNNIIHRDLKPHNILITKSGIIKISDFGLAKESITDHPLKQTYCGSPLYMAPEMMNYGKYDGRSDLWSIGVIIYEMITGNPPFHVKNFAQLKRVIQNDIHLPDKFHNLISDLLKKMLENLLQQNPEKRMDWDTFFNHPWFEMLLQLERENRLMEISMSSSLPISIPNYANAIYNNSLNMTNHEQHNSIDSFKFEELFAESDEDLYVSANSDIEDTKDNTQNHTKFKSELSKNNKNTTEINNTTEITRELNIAINTTINYKFSHTLSSYKEEECQPTQILPKKSSFRTVFQSSIDIFKQSYDYLSSHNKSI